MPKPTIAVPGLSQSLFMITKFIPKMRLSHTVELISQLDSVELVPMKTATERNAVPKDPAPSKIHLSVTVTSKELHKAQLSRLSLSLPLTMLSSCKLSSTLGPSLRPMAMTKVSLQSERDKALDGTVNTSSLKKREARISASPTSKSA